MSHPIETVRLSMQAREQLIKLKRVTGLQNWNVLCRWGLMVSLSEPSVPPPMKITTDSPIDMSWSQFGGRYESLYLALLRQRCHRDGLGTEARTLEQQFRLHLHRGIAYLAADRQLTSIADLFRRVSAHLPGLDEETTSSEPEQTSS